MQRVGTCDNLRWLFLDAHEAILQLPRGHEVEDVKAQRAAHK